jgi:nucleoside-diphosphate-sugar epimerase
MNEQVVFLEGKHVGVTGANGFLGSYICNLLKVKNAIIHAYIYPGTSTRNISKIISESGGDIKSIDITKSQTLSGKFDGLDYLFQVAGTVAEWAYPIKNGSKWFLSRPISGGDFRGSPLGHASHWRI